MTNPDSLMDPSRQREEALFELALEKPAGKRVAFLDAMCEGDAALRQRLEALLAAHEQPEGLKPLSPGSAAPTVETQPMEEIKDDTVGTTIGRYKLLQKIGEGGCGAVYMAEQQEPVRRRVALKVIKLGMDTKAVMARFEAERQALALMDHPNIAKVLDAGSTDTGRPYFVMELVRGIKITDYSDQNKLDTQQRLELFIPICQAIQHAHQKGIIHRDIKPSNVLVTLHDGIPLPKVIDFGIAKAATDQRLTDKTLFTAYEQFIGTPAYMSPEQAEMSGLDIDTRSDIYSLGVLLYEMLTGRTPFDAKELMSLGIDAMRRTIREREPVKPSTRLATLQGEDLTATAKCRAVEASRLTRLLRGDLDWIVMKCLEKDRTRRYESANGLAMDLKRHLNNETVLARPPSKLYEFQKTVRRHKVGFAATAAIIVALAAGVVGSAWQAHLAQVARQQAESEAGAAEAINAFFNDMLASVDPRHLREYSGFAIPRAVQAQGNLSHDISVVQMMLGATQRIAQAFAGKPILEATARERIGLSLLGLGRPREAAGQLGIAAEIRLNNSDANDPETLRSELQYAMSLIGSGREPEAIPLLRRLRQQMTQAFGALDPRTLQSSSLYATALMRDRKHDESDPIFRETLKRQTEILGPEHRDTIETRIWWCNSFEWRGRGGEAEVLVRPAYETALRVYGPDDVQTLFAQSQVGMSLTFQGRFTEAKDMLKPAVKGLARLVGDDHPFTCVAKSDLSRCLPDPAEQVQLLSEALRGLHVSEGKASPWIWVISRDLAQLILGRRRIDEGLNMMLSTVKDFRDKYGEDNGWSIDAMGLLDRALGSVTNWTVVAGIRWQVLSMQGVDAVEIQQILDIEKRLSAPLLRDGIWHSLTRLSNGKYRLAVGGQPLSDLSFLKNAPVEKLVLDVSRVHDLRPLENLALTVLDIRQTPVTDLSPLRAPALSSSLRELRLPQVPATDFSPVAVCTNLEVLDLSDTALANLDVVRGLKLRVALLTGSKVANIAALAGMPLERVTLARTAVTDISPLQQCPSLLELVLSPGARNVKALHSMPVLKKLSYDDFGGSSPQTAEEFWGGDPYVGLTADTVLDLSKQSIQHPQESILSLRTAVLQLWFGMDAEYAATCRRAIESAERAPKTENPDRERAAKNWCLRPSDDAAMLPRVLALAREAAETGSGSDRPWCQQALGMAEFRADHDQEAETAFLQAEQAAETDNFRLDWRPFIHGPSRFYRAMILSRQGRKEEATKLFHEAEAQMIPIPVNAAQVLPAHVNHDQVICWLAYREARALLGIPATATK